MRARYGASPLHLVVHVALFALVAWTALQLLGSLGAPWSVAVWLLGAIVAHDLILLPAYGTLDRLAARATGRAVNYVRVPLGLSLLLALVFLPVISGAGGAAFRRASGLRYEGYLGRWLLVSGLLFAASAVVFVVRERRGARRSA